MQLSQKQHFYQQISECQTVKQFALRKRFDALIKQVKSDTFEKKFNDLIAEIESSQQWVKERQDSLPEVLFTQTLPINDKREEIATLIQENQVVVLAGETGSGKTTQLPKICLSIGLGSKGLIGHTQPRRIAARTVATRIAEELNTPLGDVVGYQVRFTDEASDNTRVKLMTDGVLLAELQRDRFLKRYDVIIIDEAHERSLNIDFLLGLLKRLLKKRPDLKLIITSATIDLEKFSAHFDGAPVMEVSGRTYPVEVIYQPTIIENKTHRVDEHQGSDDNALDLPNTIARTVQRIIDSEGPGEFLANGDILVFCSGERDIRDAAKALHDHTLPVDVLPLYARLSVQEQSRVFKASQRRKVVLATNVAETSITVPGIGYVIDPGVARVSRYSFKSKVQRLPIERISQASANQRMGRCGRVANGVCIRLFSEEDFQQRAEFTEAEILRSNLAAVILQMLQIGVKNIRDFPFIDKPDNRLLNDGFKLLDELQALKRSSKDNKDKSDETLSLSKTGKLLSRIPTDPKYARILLEANKQNCLHEVLIIIAALSSQDPREWPADKKQAAREKHRLLNYHRSDFVSYLNLWETINQQRQALSNKQFKDYCHKHFLSLVRIFEWRDMVGQLTQHVKQLDWKVPRSHNVSFLPIDEKQTAQNQNNKFKNNKIKNNQGQKYDAIHKSLLAGLLGNIAFNDEDNEYCASRGRRLHIFPASVLAKKIKKKASAQRKSHNTSSQHSKWIIANELIETSRLFAHTNAEIDPAWVLQAGKHLLKYRYSAPDYLEREGVVKAQRNASLYGLDLQDKQRVLYSDIDPRTCRELFIQRALVEGAYKRHPVLKKHGKTDTSFFTHNQHIINSIEDVETKTRRRNLLVSDTDIFRLFDEVLPQNIQNFVAFEQWRKTDNNESLITFTCEQLTFGNISKQGLASLSDAPSKNDNDVVQFPNTIEVNGKTLQLSYHFNPEDPHDGVTLTLPIELLDPFPEHLGSWLVPGLLREKCIALIKTLPKQYRKRFAPAANAVDRVLANLNRQNRPLHLELGEQLQKSTGHKIPEDVWQESLLDRYYLMNYRLSGSKKKQTVQSRDLPTLKMRYTEVVSDSLRIDNAPERKAFEQDNIVQWDFGELTEYKDFKHQGMTVRAFPMLKSEFKSEINSKSNDDSQRISLSLHESKALAQFHTQLALIELALKQFTSLKPNLNYLKKEVLTPKSRNDNLSLHLLALAPTKPAQQALALKVIKSALAQCCFANAIPRTANDFVDQVTQGSKLWVESAIALESVLIDIAKQLTDVQRNINAVNVVDIATDETLEDIKNYVFDLVEEQFLSYTPIEQLKQYSRYLKVANIRLEKIHVPTPTSFKNHVAAFEKHLLEQIRHAQKIDSALSTSKQSLHFIYQSQPSLFQHRIMMREWHSSIFAQQLRTQFPISEKRVLKHWNQITTK